MDISPGEVCPQLIEFYKASLDLGVLLRDLFVQLIKVLAKLLLALTHVHRLELLEHRSLLAATDPPRTEGCLKLGQDLVVADLHLVRLKIALIEGIEIVCPLLINDYKLWPLEARGFIVLKSAD